MGFEGLGSGLADAFSNAGSSLLSSVTGQLGAALGSKLNGALGLQGKSAGYQPPTAGVPFAPTAPAPSAASAVNQPVAASSGFPVWGYFALAGGLIVTILGGAFILRKG